MELIPGEDLDERARQNTRVFLVVRGDGRQLYRSSTLRWDSDPIELEVDISDVKHLQIEIENETTWFASVRSLNLVDLRVEGEGK